MSVHIMQNCGKYNTEHLS